MILEETIAVLQRYKNSHPAAMKAEIEEEFRKRCKAEKQRSVYVGNGFVMRFCESNPPAFSGSVVSLAAVCKYPRLPVVICIAHQDRLDFRLANVTFLRRVTHTSQNLRVDKIRGTFLGGDIMDEYQGVENRPENFVQLMEMHNASGHDENIARIVEATNAIVGRSNRFEATGELLDSLMEAPARAAAALTSAKYRDAERQLSARVEARRSALLQAAAIDNVKSRGDTAEQIMTGERSGHRLDDETFALGGGGQLIVDIKTKLLDRSSAPKAYNIDKVLHALAQPGRVFSMFFIGLDAARKIVRPRLLSIFDPTLIGVTRIERLWSGRRSRGATQFSGDLDRIFAPDYRPTVDVEGGRALLRRFLEG